MAKNNYAINSFVAGECSPDFFGRFDTNPYGQGCEEIRNMLVRPQGGSILRPGFLHVERVFYALFEETPGDPPEESTGADRDVFSQVRLFPLTASDGSRWQLVAKNNTPTVMTGAISPLPSYFSNWYFLNTETNEKHMIFGINGANDTQVADELAGLSDIDLREIQFSQVGDRLNFAHNKVRPFYLQLRQERDFANNITYSFRISIRGLEDFTNDDLTAYNTLAQLPFQVPYFAPTTTQPYYNAMHFDYGSGTGGLLQTDSGVIGYQSTFIFHQGWLGRYLKLSKGGVTRAVRITAVNSSTEVVVRLVAGPVFTVDADYGKDSGSSIEIASWGGSLGWPAAVTGFESRLFYGGSTQFPDTYWATQTNNLDRMMARVFEQDPTFANPTAATDPFDSTLRSETVSFIRWLASGKNIVAGTNEREFIIQGPNAGESIGPLNIQSNAETPHGSAAARPIRVENTTVFMQRSRKEFRELVYSLDEASFTAANLNIFAPEIANKSATEQKNFYVSDESYFVDLAIQQSPLGIIWVIDNNGCLLGLTRERQQQVLAWHFHELAGRTFLTPGVGADIPFDPQITSVSVLQRPQTADRKSEPDELWVSTFRGIKQDDDSYEGKFFIERQAPIWNKATIHEGWVTDGVRREAPVYLDQAVIFNETEIEDGVLEDLPHCRGSTVSVVIAGHYIGEFLVSETNTIDISAKIADLDLPPFYGIIVGYFYRGRLMPLIPEVPAQLGSAHGEPRRVHEVTFHFVRTCSARFGFAKDDYQENTPLNRYEKIEMLTKPGQPMNTPIQMYTGERKMTAPPGYKTRPKLVIENDAPLPMHVTHIIIKQVVIES